MLPTPQNGQTSCSENILEIVIFFFFVETLALLIFILKVIC